MESLCISAKFAQSSGSAAVLKAIDSKTSKEQQPGYAEECVDGNLALSIQSDEVSVDEKEGLESVSKKSAPFLKLIKNTKTAKKVNNQSSEWAEDKNIMKSPVFLIGVILAVMVFLILFW